MIYNIAVFNPVCLYTVDIYSRVSIEMLISLPCVRCNFRKFLYYTYMVSAGTLVPILAMAGYRINELLKHMTLGLESFTNFDSPILHV